MASKSHGDRQLRDPQSAGGRPRLTDAQREKRRLAKNKAMRNRRAEVKREREDAKSKLARAGVTKTSPARVPTGGQTTDYQPMAEDGVKVEQLAGMGMRHDEIALMIVNPKTAAPINEKTLRRHFDRELREGPVKANSSVARSLYDQATGRRGAKLSTTAGIFWMKARAGWRETQHVEVEIHSGVLIPPPDTSPQDWIDAAQVENENKLEPGTEVEKAS